MYKSALIPWISSITSAIKYNDSESIFRPRNILKPPSVIVNALIAVSKTIEIVENCRHSQFRFIKVSEPLNDYCNKTAATGSHVETKLLYNFRIFLFREDTRDDMREAFRELTDSQPGLPGGISIVGSAGWIRS